MPRFKFGTHVNTCNDKKRRYLRISAGPQRGKYVHDLILEAKLGRRLRKNETCEHINGYGLDVSPENLTNLTRPENSKAQWRRNAR